MRASLLTVFFAATALACGTSQQSSTSGAGPGGSGGAGGKPVIGGDRPVEVFVPTGYSPSKPAPLLLLLHGLVVDGNIEELYLQLAPIADQRGFLYAHPDGTVDKEDRRFWNATPACCNYDGSTVDDSAYLSSVITQIEQQYAVDPKRVYVFGHSNGGFMAYRLACEHADQIAGIVSLCGAMTLDPSTCHPTAPVAVLQVHGDKDPEVLYYGGKGTSKPGDGPYPSAEQSVLDWAKLNACGATPDTSAAPQDLETSLPGAETTITKYTGCTPNSAAELWRVRGGLHIPNFNDAFRKGVFDFLDAHPKI